MSTQDTELTEQQLNGFMAYANEIESKLQLLLKESKISMDNLEQIEKDESIICPFDSSHRIPKESYANHMWHVHHYNTQFDLNEDIDFFYESAPNLHRIHLDLQQQSNKELVQQQPNQNQQQSIDYEKLPIIDVQTGIPLDYYSRMEPSDMERTINGLQQLPFTFLSIHLNLLSLSRLNTHISSLFLQHSILDDQDLINMVIALLLNGPTCHPDILTQELAPFFGSETRSFVLDLWKYLIKVEIRRIRDDLIRMGDPGVITRKERMKGETLPPMKWEFVDEEELAQKSKSNDPNVKIDYKRRRKSYRAKMTHLTRRSVIQEHRDMVNLRMQILAHDNHCNLIGDVERVITKNTPQEIEKEMRERRITPPELQFKNPLDARNSNYLKMK